jgi:hypothetical protein
MDLEPTLQSNPFECIRKIEDFSRLSDESIANLLAGICLYIGAKYLELRYPMIEDVIAVFQLAELTKERFIDVEQRIYQALEWDLQFTTLPNALEHLFSQGVIFTTDVKRESRQERGCPVSEMSVHEHESILTKAKQICLRWWPELLIYDAEFLLSAHVPTPVHLALAIVLHCRKSIGLHPLLPEELRMIAFGDIYRQEVMYDSSEKAARRAYQLVEDEV